MRNSRKKGRDKPCNKYRTSRNFNYEAHPLNSVRTLNSNEWDPLSTRRTQPETDNSASSM